MCRKFMNVTVMRKKNPTIVKRSNTLAMFSNLVNGKNVFGKSAAAMTPAKIHIQKQRPASENCFLRYST